MPKRTAERDLPVTTGPALERPAIERRPVIIASLQQSEWNQPAVTVAAARKQRQAAAATGDRARCDVQARAAQRLSRPQAFGLTVGGHERGLVEAFVDPPATPVGFHLRAGRQADYEHGAVFRSAVAHERPATSVVEREVQQHGDQEARAAGCHKVLGRNDARCQATSASRLLAGIWSVSFLRDMSDHHMP
jgi:hypothetical protein